MSLYQYTKNGGMAGYLKKNVIWTYLLKKYIQKLILRFYQGYIWINQIKQLLIALIIWIQIIHYGIISQQTILTIWRSAPGKILIQYIVENAFEHGIKKIDFGIGNQHYKYIFANKNNVVFDFVTFNNNKIRFKLKRAIDKIVIKTILGMNLVL